MSRPDFSNAESLSTIADQRTESLFILESVAGEMIGKYGACAEADQDPYQAALWGWIATEVRGARELIEKFCEADEKRSGTEVQP